MRTTLDRDALLVDIDAVLASLSGALSVADREGGWSVQRKRVCEATTNRCVAI
jgi:hypothetical protein